jgi:small-conductance mechanosensitive channel
MDQQGWTAVITAIGTSAGAVLGGVGGWVGKRKSDARAERAAEQAERLAEQSAEQKLIDAINDALVRPLQKEVGELRRRLELAEEKIDTLEDRNDRLVAFIYKLVGIIRRAGADHEILPADVPPGIHL